MRQYWNVNGFGKNIYKDDEEFILSESVDTEWMYEHLEVKDRLALFIDRNIWQPSDKN